MWHLLNKGATKRSFRLNEISLALKPKLSEEIIHQYSCVSKLLENILIISNKVKYFGHLITDKIMDNEDIYTQC